MRINEDYIEVVDRNDIVNDNELSMDVQQNVQWLLDGRSVNINFDVIDLPVYKVNNRDELERLIDSCIEAYGTECNLNWIDVSEIRSMKHLFLGSLFNGDISGWNVSNVIDMSYMFAESNFNRDISKWDVSNVTNMRGMFEKSRFNGDISRWAVSNVTNMSRMFEKSLFNGDISEWDVSNVTEMSHMFFRCYINNKFKPRKFWYFK